MRFSRAISRRGWLLAVACACGDSRDTTSETPADVDTGAGSGGASAGGANASGRGSEGGGAAPAGAGGGPGMEAAGAAGQAASPGLEGLTPRLRRYHGGEGNDRSLRFELDSVEGLSPHASSLEYLEVFVGRALGKPDGVHFDADETLAPAGSEHVWSFDELDAFSKAHARDDADGPVSIHVLFIDGSYDSGDGGGTVLGLAWGQRYIALFQDPIRAGCSGGLLGALSNEACESAERNVWAHEIGHVIGLVDNGLVQQANHRDAEHGRHDASDGCLMYWAYDRPAIFDVLRSRIDSSQSTDVDFCENCWADLNAAKLQ